MVSSSTNSLLGTLHQKARPRSTPPYPKNRATLFLLPHPSPSPSKAQASMSALDIIEPGESGPYVPAFRGLLPGGISGFGAEFVAVDEGEKWCQANLSVPEAADMTVVDAVTMLDLRSGITTTYLLGSRTSCKRRFLMYKLWGVRHTRGNSSWQMPGCSRSRKKHARCGSRCTPAGVRSPWIRFFSPSCRGKTMLSFSASQR